MDEQPLGPLLRFSAYAALPDERLELALGALLITEAVYPGLDHRRYIRQLDTFAEQVRAELGMRDGELLPVDAVGRRETAEHVAGALRDVLAGREGFHGNQDDYYNPRNSFLNEVLETRVGLPITLSIVYIEIAKRLGAPLVGVGLPAHFVAKWPLSPDEGDDLFVDAFSGRLMDLDNCRDFMRSLTVSAGGPQRFDIRWLEPVDTRAILTRMLNNLKHIYLQEGDTRAALDMVDRLVLLRPELPEELRDRGLLRLAVGETLLAAADLAAYAERAPAAPEVKRLRKRLASIGEIRGKLN
jgi:regulator of sirC expression with transglutaminase-like and TPR domain